MFSPNIVDSDAFLEMPASAQSLYFHLGMRADDDGFVGNPKKIMRMINVGEDDLKILLAKRFILTFESGVIVIKHWRINNLIRKDWYRETIYKDEKELLSIKDNGSYTEKRLVNENVPGSSTQVRLGKVRLGNTLSAKAEERSLEPIDDDGNPVRITKRGLIKTINQNPYIFTDELQRLKNAPQKQYKIVAHYWAFKAISFSNREQHETALGRDVVAAKKLVGYSSEQIQRTMEYCQSKWPTEWTLETCVKWSQQ